MVTDDEIFTLFHVEPIWFEFGELGNMILTISWRFGFGGQSLQNMQKWGVGTRFRILLKNISSVTWNLVSRKVLKTLYLLSTL
jgi:hypothetical protein